MATVQWRPEVNALTTPDSYSIRFVSRGSAGLEDIAADIALRHPNFSKADIMTILSAEDKAVMERLLNGEPIEHILPNAALRETPCRSCCEMLGSASTCCRAIELDGALYEGIPWHLIRQAVCAVARCC